MITGAVGGRFLLLSMSLCGLPLRVLLLVVAGLLPGWLLNCWKGRLIVVMLELDPEIEKGLVRRAALTEHSVEEVAEAILSQVLLDEE